MCPCMRSSPCFDLLQLKDKAEAREKERIKMEEKKAKKRESSFRQLLKAANPALTAESKWEEVHKPLYNDMKTSLSQHVYISYAYLCIPCMHA